MPRWSIKLGFISRERAREALTKFLGVDPWWDIRVLFWACQRARVGWAKRTLTPDQAWIIRYGLDEPGEGPRPTPRSRPPARRGRPHEVAVDDANVYLIWAFPQFRTNPLYLALLEYVFHVDTGLQLPTEEQWKKNRDRAAEQHALVREAARARIKRAMQLLDLNDGAPLPTQRNMIEERRRPRRK